tara:strand:- start:453 stop:980 length:528 start_codon:yes stop_codon:yes gene_type:complete
MALGQLQQVNQVEVTSAQATVTITGVDTDCPYLLVLNSILPDTDNATLRMRFTAGGSNVSTANYDTSGVIAKVHASFVTTTTQNQNQFHNLVSSGTGNNNEEKTDGFFYFYNMYVSDQNSRFVQKTAQRKSDGTEEFIYSQGVYTVNEQHDGFYFFFTSGNIASGKFTLYKILGF